jgi:sensor histidine kinase regulating citrate/malate metabolism
MLGNALDNAIESVEKADNKKDRFITAAVRQERAFALIQIRNHMEGEIQMRDGLPLTSKKDTENHGYGTQSIRAIAEKYHGSMTIAAEEGIFTITILLPLPDDIAEKTGTTI